MLQNYFRNLTLLVFLAAATVLFSHCKSDDPQDEPKTYPQLYINEVMPDNETVIEDEAGEHDDWIEIYNPNDEPVDLAGWYITDDQESYRQYQFPFGNTSKTTIPAKGFALLWADEQPGQGALHLNFRLSSSGESVYLSPDGVRVVHQVAFGPQGDVQSPGTDQSVGLETDGASGWQIFESPTPGYSNEESPGHPTALFINEFMAANDSFIADGNGEFDDWVEIFNGGTEPVDFGGWYITDDSTNLQNWQIADTSPELTTIPPGGFLLLWADEQPEQGILHVGVKLNMEGEYIGISADGITYLDFIRYGPESIVAPPPPDYSAGRISDGGTQWMTFQPGTENPPTPGSGNQP